MAILTQTAGTSAAGDLTNAIGNSRLAALCGNSSGVIATASITDVVEAAEAETLSILGPSFSTTAASTKTIVKHHCKQIAIYYVYARAPEFRNERGECIMTQQYEMSVKALEKIASGQRDMGDETTTGKAAVVGGAVNYSTKNFIVETAESTTGPSGGF